MLVNIHAQSKVISYMACLTQLYLFMIFVGMDNFLLTVMEIDQFVAICHPLKYTVIMSPELCGLLFLLCWLVTFFISMLHILLLMLPTFSVGTEIPHFFCDLAQLLKVTSLDTFINNICLYLVTSLVGVFSMSGILFSYSQIVSSLVRMSSTENKYKAFSTCGSHLCVISLFYGTGLWVYLSSSVAHSSQEISVASAMYTIVTPMLNPFIYSLRNEDVKGALVRLLSRAASCP
jgi:olfactory receptor